MRELVDESGFLLTQIRARMDREIDGDFPLTVSFIIYDVGDDITRGITVELEAIDIVV